MRITNTYEYQRLRGLKRKFELIKLKGGCCEKCGYKKNIAGFDFHHTDPEKKDYQLDMRKLSNTSMKKLMLEVEKCQLLCATCHREEHFPELDMLLIELLINEINDSVLDIKDVGKPKCLDCDVEINYTHKRCRECSNLNKRKIERPDIEILKSEVEKNSQGWCGIKYNVSRTTIRRWLGYIN